MTRQPKDALPMSRALVGLAIKNARAEAAVLACQHLLDAYRRGAERGGSIDWDDIDRAYQTACLALGVTEADA